MKRTMAVAMSLALLTAVYVGPAEAGKRKKKTRTATAAYEAPAIGAPESGGLCLRPTNSCGDIPTSTTEKFVVVKIDDASGTPVAFNLAQDTDPATLGTEHKLGTFCGTTGKKAIAIKPGYPLVVFPWAFGGAQCPGSFGTQGTVTAKLSNRR